MRISARSWVNEGERENATARLDVSWLEKTVLVTSDNVVIEFSFTEWGMLKSQAQRAEQINDGKVIE